MENFVSLVREMRSAFGSRYGISVAIAASYWYLRGFDPKAMEPYVDWFGVMTYDLHGPWDKSVKHIGPIVAGHTNVPEIYNWTLPLWYAGLDPAKLNFGLAYYGRGYTLADRSCDYDGCTWSDASRPYPCTNFPGVASLQEIEASIKQDGLTPRLLEDDMIKVLVSGDQWMGYDDLETIAMKKQFASSLCFGGTMIWSVDLYSGAGSGNSPDGSGSGGSPASADGQGGEVSEDSDDVVYIDPSIWNEANPEINCQPPCSFVLPPLQLSEPTTISIPPMTTSLEVAYLRTTIVTTDGSKSTSTYYSRTTITTVIIIPAVTTTEIEVWGRTIRNTDTDTALSSSFFITSSVRPPIVTVTNDPDPENSDTTTGPPVTRTIHPPPFPYIRPSTSSTDGARFPIVTYKPGPPKPKCTSPSICGRPCRIFCGSPCPPGLCPDGSLDFPDPIPPPGPPPSDPSSEGSDTSTPETEENNEEEEDDEERCEIEFGLPPGGDDSDRTDPPYVTPRVTRTPDPTIASPSPTPTPSPPPNPDPPTPRRDTEDRKCYDSGALTGRGDAIKAVEHFCDYAAGRTLDDATQERKSIQGIDSAVGGFVSIVQSVTVRNGCKFDINRDECGRIMRRILDECDTTSTRFKQGGTVEDNCATWRLDPQVDIENLLCFIPLYRAGDYIFNGGGDCG
jgi:chitinase